MSVESLVTVIVPTWNRSRVLRCALESVQRQTFTNLECIVVGDGCTDDSEAVVRGLDDARFQWVNLPANSGSQSLPNNEGLRRARGTYVAYLGHDDLWFPWHLENSVRRIQETGADFVYGLELEIGPDGVKNAYGPPSRGRDYYDDPLPPSCWLYRRVLHDRVGPWRGSWEVETWVDHDYLRRLVAMGARIEGTSRLSVIRFASHDWKLYLREGDFPQLRMVERLGREPEAVEQELLTSAMLAFARQRNPLHGPRAAIRHTWDSVLVRVLRRMGLRSLRPAWFRRWWYQRERATARQQRGLRPDTRPPR